MSRSDLESVILEAFKSEKGTVTDAMLVRAARSEVVSGARTVGENKAVAVSNAKKAVKAGKCANRHSNRNWFRRMQITATKTSDMIEKSIQPEREAPKNTKGAAINHR